MGTIGGNLFAPAPFGDFATALLALDATVQLQGGYGAARNRRSRSSSRARERNASALVLSVSLPRPASAEAFRYRKVARIKPKGGSVLTHRRASADERRPRHAARASRSASMGATAAARQERRAGAGRPLARRATIAAAAAAALEGLSPADDALASAWYRREVAGVHLRRLLSGRSRSDGKTSAAIPPQRPRGRAVRRRRHQSADGVARADRRHRRRNSAAGRAAAAPAPC